jgi:hypothetical protein
VCRCAESCKEVLTNSQAPGPAGAIREIGAQIRSVMESARVLSELDLEESIESVITVKIFFFLMNRLLLNWIQLQFQLLLVYWRAVQRSKRHIR